jgi:hypothetical protein
MSDGSRGKVIIWIWMVGFYSQLRRVTSSIWCLPRSIPSCPFWHLAHGDKIYIELLCCHRDYLYELGGGGACSTRWLVSSRTRCPMAAWSLPKRIVESALLCPSLTNCRIVRSCWADWGWVDSPWKIAVRFERSAKSERSGKHFRRTSIVTGTRMIRSLTFFLSWSFHMLRELRCESDGGGSVFWWPPSNSSASSVPLQKHVSGEQSDILA